MHEIHTDQKGRYIILICTINNTSYTIVNLYAPNVGQLKFLNSLYRKVGKVRKGSLLLVGGFNTIVDQKIDVSKPSSHVRPTFQDFLRRNLLYDL